jgi:enterochelin esterase-like enzyme
MESGRIHLLGPYEVPGLAAKRLVRVYVPRRARPALRPTLVMFDGQNVFDDEPSFAGGWHVHEAVEKLAAPVPPPVVVAIDHGHHHRIQELSPFEVRGVAGHADVLVAWMAEVLLPELRRSLALDPDPRKVVVGGSSMGGLAALYAHARTPDAFGGALAMSPSLWVAGKAIVRWLANRQLAPWSRIYLDGGRREAGGALVRDLAALAEVLRHRRGQYVLFRDDPRGGHREADWRRRLPPALRFFFGTSRSRARG